MTARQMGTPFKRELFSTPNARLPLLITSASPAIGERGYILSIS